MKRRSLERGPGDDSGSTVRARNPRRWLLLLATFVAAGGCSAAGSSSKLAPTWLDLGTPNLTSFMGVPFGSSIDRVRDKLPDGDFETSPYGADAWRVQHVESGGVRYQEVVFEFSGNMGMQLAIAQFAPGDGASVLTELKHALGEPTALRPVSGASDPDALIARWELPHNERVTFNGPDKRVEMLGPAGSPLRHDLVLRRATAPATE